MFRIVLMLDAMGMYLLIRYKTTPTTISTMTTFKQRHFLVLLQFRKSNFSCVRSAEEPLGIRAKEQPSDSGFTKRAESAPDNMQRHRRNRKAAGPVPAEE
jgi:hypothetical protein